MPNLLINENSPYLLQHADNPINWYPWGDEALNRAKRENKPIFLSIGYSTCYWCHRMASEAFSDEKTADFLNDNFICIKVDKEERPDVDTVYMEAATRLTENVGWPLNMFLTPDGKPFFAGTYFPLAKSDGLIDFLSLAKAVKKEYKDNNKFILENADAIVEDMKNNDLKPQKITEDVITNALWVLKSTFDDRYGGFGEAPKFLISQQIFFLLRYWYLYREEYSLYMVEKTLDNIAKGEIYDSKKGGFFRYAVTKEWGSPHYEKMLYTNSLMAIAFLEGFEVVKKPLYKEIVEETLRYLRNVLLSKSGGFYSAEDSLAQEAEKNNEEVFIDKKISTGLNGITIACFSMVGKAFNSKEYIEIAENTVQFVWDNIYLKTGELNSYIIDGKISKQIYSSDYAYFIWGLLELYQVTYNKNYLDKAILLNEKLIEHFWDKENGGVFLYPKSSEALIINPKEVYDGAIPSVNAVCEMNFYRLSRLSKNYELSVMARNILDSLGEIINKVPTDYLYHLCSFFYGRTPKEIIVSKDKKDILDVLNGEFRPFTLEVMEE